MTVRELFAIALTALVVLSTVALPAIAQPTDAFDGKLSGNAEIPDGFLGEQPAEAVTYDGDLGYFVTYDEDDDLDSIEAWIDESDAREVIAYDNASNRVLLTAPEWSVYGGVGWISIGEVAAFDLSRPTISDGLVTASYVETIDLNVRMTYAEPVSILINESGYQRPAPDAAVPGRFDPSGVAFNEDADRANLSTVRDSIGASNVSGTGANQTVAVIDTGANVGSGRIYGNGTAGSSVRITAAKNFISNESVNVSASNPDWSTIEDGNGHGSWVASAVAANVSGTSHDGIAPDADLVIAKALDDEGAGQTQDIAEAIDWAEDNGADVIVMSLGSPFYSPTLQTELEEAVNGSVSVAVIAAGNSRMTTRYIASPADSPVEGVVAVAATNTSTRHKRVQSAYFSSVGPDPARDRSNGVTVGQGPDVAAPGMRVVAPTLSKTDGVRRNVSLSGTSMATPIVGGGYAVVLERRSEWRNTTAVAEWTSNTSRRLPEAGTSEVGAGLLAVDHLVNETTVDDTQAEVREQDAIARDSANEALGGNDAVSTGIGLLDQIRSSIGA